MGELMAFFTHPTSWLSCPWHSRTLTEDALSRTRERVPTLTPTLTLDFTIRFSSGTYAALFNEFQRRRWLPLPAPLRAS